MSREDRAKQFMPFAALKGYPEALRLKEKIADRSDGKNLKNSQHKSSRSRYLQY